jgi:hypothetical protein
MAAYVDIGLTAAADLRETRHAVADMEFEKALSCPRRERERSRWSSAGRTGTAP